MPSLVSAVLSLIAILNLLLIGVLVWTWLSGVGFIALPGLGLIAHTLLIIGLLVVIEVVLVSLISVMFG